MAWESGEERDGFFPILLSNSVSNSACNNIHLIMLFPVLFETMEDTDLIREENQK